MAKISELPQAAEVSGAEAIPIVQSGETKQATVNQIRGVQVDGITVTDNSELQLTANGQAVGAPAELPPQNGDYNRFEMSVDWLKSFTDTANKIYAYKFDINKSNCHLYMYINFAYRDGDTKNFIPILPPETIPGVVWNGEFVSNSECVETQFTGLILYDEESNATGYMSIPFLNENLFCADILSANLKVAQQYTFETQTDRHVYNSAVFDFAFDGDNSVPPDELQIMYDALSQMITGVTICLQKQPNTKTYPEVTK